MLKKFIMQNILNTNNFWCAINLNYNIILIVVGDLHKIIMFIIKHIIR